jgi:hypothetical protein
MLRFGNAVSHTDGPIWATDAGALRRAGGMRAIGSYEAEPRGALIQRAGQDRATTTGLPSFAVGVGRGCCLQLQLLRQAIPTRGAGKTSRQDARVGIKCRY